MDEKRKVRIYRTVVIILALVLLALGIDIDIELHRISSSVPVVISENADTTQSVTSSEHTEQCETSVSAVTSQTEISQETSSQTTFDSASNEIEQNQTTLRAEITEITEVTTSASTTAQVAEEKTSETHTQKSAVDSEQIYYVTKSGKKYHIGTCSYLSKSKIEITAVGISSGGYEPCSRCIK